MLPSLAPSLAACALLAGLAGHASAFTKNPAEAESSAPIEPPVEAERSAPIEPPIGAEGAPAIAPPAEKAVSASGRALIDGSNLDAMVEIARQFGSARLHEDRVGDPLITGRVDGVRYHVFFYGCVDGADCVDVLFTAYFTEIDADIRAVNQFNADTRFGKGYIDGDGDPVLEMAVNLRHGITEANWEDTIDWWTVALDSFVDSLEESMSGRS